MPFKSYFSVIPAFVLITLFTAICPPFGMFFKKTSRKIRAVAFFSAIGTCHGVWMILRYCPYSFFFEYTFILRTACMILAIPFTFALCLILWHRLEELFRSVYEQAGVKKFELVFYAVIFLLYCAFVTVCFMSSKAFYESNALGDVIYSSDSPDLIKFNAFVLIDHHQNDIRQPLFSIFSAPLMGIPCLIGNLIPGIPMALILDYAQIALLLFTTFMLATRLKLSALQRVSFMLVSFSAYSVLLFSVMIEQYILAYFWLVMTFCFFDKEKEAGPLALAASGSLLTSGILVPFIYFPKTFSMESVFAFVKKAFFWAGDFLFIMLMAGRLHTLCNASYSFLVLSTYMGDKVSFSGRVLQYFNFVSGYFVTPASEMQINENMAVWQLKEVTSLSVIGVVIFVLAFAAFFCTRKEQISKIALGWILFSVAVLIVVGWGTAENGLILYSLYFGWPFLVLIFNCLKSLENKLNTRIMVPLCSVVLSVVMLISNIPGIYRMVEFAVSNYPA